MVGSATLLYQIRKSLDYVYGEWAQPVLILSYSRSENKTNQNTYVISKYNQ